MRGKKLLLAAALAAAFAAPGVAWADYDTAIIIGAVNSARDAVAARVDGVGQAVGAMQNAVVNAISGSTQTLAAQQAKSAELTSEANQRTQSVMQQTRNEQRYEHPDACAVVAASKGEADAVSDALKNSVGRGGGSGARSPSGGVSSNMQKAMDIRAGRVEAPSVEVQAALISSGACSSFAASGTVRGAACTKAGFAPNASNGHPDADVRAETLIDGPQSSVDPSAWRKRRTIDPTGNDRAALEAYVGNLDTPVDLRALNRAELNSDTGRKYMSFRDAYDARMALALKPAKIVAADMIASADLKPVVDQLLQSDVTGPFVKAYLDKAYPAWSTNGISVDELLNLEAERRYLNKDWHVKMASLPPEALVREQTTMMAAQNLLLTRIYDRLGLLSVTSGQTMATGVRQEMLPQLIALHDQAAK